MPDDGSYRSCMQEERQNVKDVKKYPRTNKLLLTNTTSNDNYPIANITVMDSRLHTP